MNKVFEVLENNLQINTDDIVIKRDHETGEISGSKQRTVAVKFNSFNDKIITLENNKKLKGIRISTYKDCLKEALAIRKEKWRKVLSKRPLEKFCTCSIEK